MLSLMVDWYGPFGSVAALQAAVKRWGQDEVLYLATGRRSRQRESDLQYVGISLAADVRLNDLTHKITTYIRKEHAIWVGYVVSHSIAGRRATHHPTKHSIAVEQAEWMLAYLLTLPLNEKKRDAPPKDSGILVNRWFDGATEKRRVRRAHKEWPDFLEYDKDRDIATIVWFGGNRKRLSGTDIKELRSQRRLVSTRQNK